MKALSMVLVFVPSTAALFIWGWPASMFVGLTSLLGGISYQLWEASDDTAGGPHD